MNEGIKKFEELLRTDESFQAKLKAAVEAYTGEEDKETVFNSVLVPLAEEYGISVSYEEFIDYISNLADTVEMNKEELMQIAGGKGGGVGAGKCFGVGVGWGYAIGDDGAVGCIIIGHGSSYCCIGEGDSDGETVRKKVY